MAAQPAPRDAPAEGTLTIEVYDPITISEARLREIEETERKTLPTDEEIALILHEVTFLRHDVRRLRKRVDDAWRLMLWVLALAVAIILVQSVEQ